MPKKLTPRQARLLRASEQIPPELIPPVHIPKAKNAKPLEGKTKNQKLYIAAIEDCDVTFGLGPAGVGKTYVCGCMAADAFKNEEVEKIVITRPAVEAGEKLGALPGNLEEKYHPYLTPFLEVLYERLGKGHVEALLKNGTIEAAPLALMRGRTFKNAMVILDEAQNTTPTQMKMFLTRLGEGSRMVINGDEEQSDIPGPCGLTHAVTNVGNLHGIRVIRFTAEDVVRHDLVQRMLQAYAANSGKGRS